MPKKILVIDDDELLRDMIKQMLEKAEHEISVAPDGRAGLKVLEERPVDVVITDLIMPEMEGIETIRRLKKDYPSVKIIAMSGGGSIASDEYLDLANRFGVHKTLAKPFTHKELLDAVDALD